MDPILQEYQNILGIQDIEPIIENLDSKKISTSFFTESVKLLQVLHFDTETRILQETENTEEILTEIAKGTFGKIYKSEISNYVYKEVICDEKDTIQLESNNREMFLELFIQNVLSHDPLYGKNIGKVYRLYRSEISDSKPVRLYVKMKYISDSFCKRMFQYREKLAIADFLPFLQLLCMILEGLRKKYAFYHKDLHSGNIMFHDKIITIIDFSFSCIEWRGKQYALPDDSGKIPRSHDVLIFVSSFLYYYQDKLESLDDVEFLVSMFQTNRGTNLYEYWIDQAECPVFHLFYDWKIPQYWPHWLQQEMEQSHDLFEPQYIRKRCLLENAKNDP